MKRKVLFVCTGNTCRSSMAELLAKKILEDMGKAELVEVNSAGTMAWPGEAANSQAVSVMDELGLDLSYHKTTPLEPTAIEGAHLIVAMTQGHKQQVLALSREKDLEDEIEVLDVPDPIGGSDQEYRQCRDYLKKAINQLFEKHRGFLFNM